MVVGVEGWAEVFEGLEVLLLLLPGEFEGAAVCDPCGLSAVAESRGVG